jgi:PAS domain S-box-containing protein
MTVEKLAVLLGAREQELSAIYQNVPGILFYIAIEPDREFRFLSISDAWLVATGLTREQVVGSLVRDIIPSPSREMVLNHYGEAILMHQTVRWEEMSVYPAGRRYGEVAVTPLYDANGVATHLIGIVHDITERKLLEQSHREEEELQAFQLRLSDALRPLSDPLDVQEVAARLLGEHLRSNRVGYAEIDGRDYVIRREYASGVRPLVGEGPVGTFGVALRDAYRNGETVVVNDVSTDPRFTEAERTIMQARQIAAYVGVTLIKGGRLVAAFGANNATPRVWTSVEVELIRGVAERTWEAVERARAEKALREREQRLRLALDASRAGSWTRDFRADRAEQDDRFREIYGFKAGEPVSFEAWLSRVHEEDRRRVRELWEQIVHTKTHDTFDITFRIVRPDGGVSWIQSLGRADRDADGQVIRLTGIELDITERRRAEEALQARRDEERDRTLRKQADEALRRSHAELERRTLQLRRLASDLTLAEQHAREELAKTLHDGLQQLLFSAVMTVDRAVAGNSQADQVALLQRASADLHEAMEAARTLSVNLFPPMLHIGGLPAALAWLARRTQEQYGVVVNVTADPHAKPATRDVRILLFEAVRELLFNAVKHAHVDRVDVNLELGSDDSIHIHVSDEGVGFDPAATLHHKSHHQVGLGLFSIEERLALFGGHLDIQSAPGKGARFSVTLPRSDLLRLPIGVMAPHAGWQERLVYDSADGTSKPLRILIADDHVVARAGLRELLSERPELQVVGEAANGVEAISQAMALQPDVIVMDASMPQMNGIEATREIRGALPHIHIVGLSTHDDEHSARSMREAGAEAYFTKNEGADRLLNYLLSVQTQAKGAAES